MCVVDQYIGPICVNLGELKPVIGVSVGLQLWNLSDLKLSGEIVNKVDEAGEKCLQCEPAALILQKISSL